LPPPPGQGGRPKIQMRERHAACAVAETAYLRARHVDGIDELAPFLRLQTSRGRRETKPHCAS
jgi:hypothetical protein